jgi:peptide/nickel transport system substrate-binding protein
MVARSEMATLAASPPQGMNLGLTSGTTTRLFNAGLSLENAQGSALPYLAEDLPRLNTDTWRVQPDGRMETTYRLRPSLTWHDGAPLTARDFVFSWRVYAVPELGRSDSPPRSLIDDVVAADDRTLVIRWTQPYADAAILEAGGGGGTGSGRSFPALPGHILEQPFAQVSLEAFTALPFWSTAYVGLGPFKLDRWEQGAFFEGSAFDGHGLGRPRIERFRVLFAPDFNTTVANMLSGEGHITIDDSIRHQQGLILKREWSTNNGGTVLVYPALWRWVQIQQRPEYAATRALLDARVRKALIHSVDRAALNEALFEGEGIIADAPIEPNLDYYPRVDRVVTKYAFDTTRAHQLLAEVGLGRGGDGFLTSPTLGRFGFDLAVLQSPQNEAEMSIMAATWRPLGIDVREVVWSAAQGRDRELRQIHSGLSTTSGSGGEQTLSRHNSVNLPRPENNWGGGSGANRGGWLAPPEFDRLADAFNATLDREQRIQMLVDMARIFSEEAAVISLYFNPTVTAFVAGLRGPQPVVPTSDVAWNVHEWEFQ